MEYTHLVSVAAMVQLAAFKGSNPDQCGGGQGDGAGVELRIGVGNTAVGGIAQLSGSGENHLHTFNIVVYAVGVSRTGVPEIKATPVPFSVPGVGWVK